MIDKVFHNVLRPTQLRLRQGVSEAVDRALNVATTDEAVARKLGRDIDVFRRTWRAWGWSGVFRVLHHLSPGPGDVVIDFGCGAGRFVCAAATRASRRVIGVELDPEFAALARANAEGMRRRRSPIEIVEGDAAAFAVPDDVTVVFLYNPFERSVLDAVIDQLLASYDRQPRRLRLAYANPVEHEALTATGRVRPTGRLQCSWRPGSEWARSQTVQFYEIVPAGPLPPAVETAGGETQASTSG